MVVVVKGLSRGCRHGTRPKCPYYGTLGHIEEHCYKKHGRPTTIHVALITRVVVAHYIATLERSTSTSSQKALINLS